MRSTFHGHAALGAHLGGLNAAAPLDRGFCHCPAMPRPLLCTLLSPASMLGSHMGTQATSKRAQLLQTGQADAQAAARQRNRPVAQLLLCAAYAAADWQLQQAGEAGIQRRKQPCTAQLLHVGQVSARRQHRRLAAQDWAEAQGQCRTARLLHAAEANTLQRHSAARLLCGCQQCHHIRQVNGRGVQLQVCLLPPALVLAPLLLLALHVGSFQGMSCRALVVCPQLLLPGLPQGGCCLERDLYKPRRRVHGRTSLGVCTLQSRQGQQHW